MDKLELDVDFLLNDPAVKAATARIKKDVEGVGVTSEQASKKVAQNVENMVKPQIGLIERLQEKLAEYQEQASKATTVKGVELANDKIQQYEQELQRLNRIGKQGFDDLGNKITKTFERPVGELNRTKEALKLYQKYAGETFNPELLAKYNAKIEETKIKLLQLNKIGTSGYDGSGNSLSVRPTGKLEKLQYVAKQYEAFSAGSVNPDIISKYNKKLQETQLEIGRVKNIGKDGFDALGNAVKGSTNVVGKAWSGLRILANVLPGVGVAGILAFAIEPITTYLASLDLFSKKIAEAIKLKAMLTEVQLKGAKDAQSEVTNLKLLYQQYQNANIPLTQRKEAYSELQKMYPNYFGNLKFENEATEKTKTSYDKLTTSIIATARARAAADKITENAKRQLDNETAINEAAVKQKQVDADIARNKSKRYNGGGVVVGSSSLTVGTGDTDQVNTIKAVKLEKERADLIKIQNNAKTDSNILAKRNLALETMITEQTLKGGKIVGSVGGTAPAKGKSAETMLNQQRSLQAQVDQIEAEYTRKSKSKDESEIQAVRDKFKKIADEVEAFNANPKNKYKVDGSGLEKTRDAAIADLTFRQDTAKAALAYEKQKKLFEDYENFKTSFGKAAAEKRFGDEVKTNADRLKSLQDDYTRLSLKSSLGGGLNGGEQERLEQEEKQIKELKSIDEKRYEEAYNIALTHNQNIERINEDFRRKAADLGKGITEDQKASLARQRDNAVNSAKDEALAKTDIYKKLAENTFETTRNEVKEGAKVLRSLLKDETLTPDLKAQIEAELKKLEVTLNVGVNQSNLDSLKVKLSLLKDSMNPEKNGGIVLSPKETKRVLKDLSDVQGKVDKLNGTGSGKAKSNFAQGLSENFDYLKGTSKEVAAGVSKDLGALSGSFGELTEAVGGVNTKTGYALDTVAKLAKVGSDAAGAFSSFASGDIVGGVTKAISAVAGLFSIGKKVKEMNAAARKEVADFYSNAIAGERAYQDLLKERELQTIRNNKVALQGVRDEIALRKSQSADYDKEATEIMSKLQAQSYITSESYTHGTWFRKASVNKTYGSLNGMSFQQLSQLLAQGKLEGDAKALVERLKELEQKGYDAGQAILDLAKETQEIFTGTTADNLTDSLLNMFKEGKTGAQDLADFFKQTMDDAALSIFKNKVLSAQMNKFYDEFAKASESDDSLSSSEINDLQKLFTTLTDEAKTKFEDLKKITGSDLSGSGSSSGISGQIKREVTEQTASELVGLQRSMYDITKQHVAVSRDSLSVMRSLLLSQYEVQTNTYNTVEELKKVVIEVKGINSNTKASGSSAYNRGF